MHDVSPLSVVGSENRGGGKACSDQEREFARQFVLNGGNGTKAAVLADYSNPSVAAHRCLTRPRVLAEVKRLMTVNASAYLPIAIRVLVDIACISPNSARHTAPASRRLIPSWIVAE